jgi:hypothetical protein
MCVCMCVFMCMFMVCVCMHVHMYMHTCILHVFKKQHVRCLGDQVLHTYLHAHTQLSNLLQCDKQNEDTCLQSARPAHAHKVKDMHMRTNTCTNLYLYTGTTDWVIRGASLSGIPTASHGKGKPTCQHACACVCQTI